MEVTRELVLPAPPDEVWEELTDPERLEEWFASEVELEVEEGGEGHFRWENGEERHAVVEEVEEGRRLGYRWTDEDGNETHVGFTIEEVDEGTRVVVTETAPVAEWGPALELRAFALAVA
ncbi:MAG TPA: SRPBCC domain-containing protein [Gaiellaceae bacterium]